MSHRYFGLLAAFSLVAACATSTPPVAPAESAQEQVCRRQCSCESCTADEADACDDEISHLRLLAEGRCEPELDTYLTCLLEVAECADGFFSTSFCKSNEKKLYGCLDTGNTCPSANDGVCDEPEGSALCPEGTDVVDCGGGGCPYLNNGQCDEPEGTGLCPEGTDPIDCGGGGCAYTNDGQCDEPEGTGLCSEGTDPADCGATPTCQYTNDGECDEPEGTGLCPEGTDVADCTGASCGSCSDYVGGLVTYEEMCPSSMALYDAVVQCACSGPCASQCVDDCQGTNTTDACTSCINASCASQAQACFDDV